jgi:hypothetical protein
MSFKIKAIPKNKDNLHGGRNTHISYGYGSFDTPYRTALDKEYNANGSLPHTTKINNPISEFILDFNNKTIEDFLQGNGSFGKRKNNLRQSAQLMRQFPILTTIVTPTNFRVPLSKKKLIFELQNISEVSIMSLPPFIYSSIEEFKKEVTNFIESAHSAGKEAMPILHIEPEPKNIKIFKEEFEALRSLQENDLVHIIGFKYNNIDYNPQQFNEIYLHKDENIWYHCFNVIRKNKETNTANIHSPQNWGLDTVSPRTITLSVQQVKGMLGKNKSITPANIKIDNRFDSPTLGVLKEELWRLKYSSDLHCDCEICKKLDLEGFKEKYSHDKDGSFNPMVLVGAGRIHELISGNDEFQFSKDAIKSDDLPSYYDKHEYTRGKIPPPKVI